MSIDRIWDLFTKKFNNEISKEELEELKKDIAGLLKEHDQGQRFANNIFGN